MDGLDSHWFVLFFLRDYIKDLLHLVGKYGCFHSSVLVSFSGLKSKLNQIKSKL